MSTRRDLLKSGSMLCAASLLPPVVWAKAPVAANTAFSAENLFLYNHGLMTETNFNRHVGSVFTVLLADRRRSSIRLKSVTNLTEAASTSTASSSRSSIRKPVATENGFVLAFAIEGLAFAQDTYELDHGVMGKMAMFLVSADTTGAVRSCSATFNFSTATTAAAGTGAAGGAVASPLVLHGAM